MSAVIKTATPFVIEEVLIEALLAVGAEPKKVTSNEVGLVQRNRLKVGDILTNRSDYNGRQLFRFERDRWVMMHDSDEYTALTVGRYSEKGYTKVSKFLNDVSGAYESAYGMHLEKLAEQERIRLEEERKARVETTRQQAIAKAKAQGYSVKETTNSKGQILLILTRMV
ncbi:hypothetical protein [Shewanella seohaensis]|uniref:hypothetical protein n=1 Tax=Shewanella seohaensis TaxID=755175 RepID=UPI00200DAD4F|nr:hypothetical protein [Shewanella seohaensis]MCL1120121.1 hypothetical protein [Shewanella seohaensis]